jgi:proteasome lid subunit RPN8/RPN11
MAIKDLAPLSQFASWCVPEFPGAIEYPLEVMDEIRAFACDELLQLSHGGREVGGVVFGTRREDLVRILTWRPIACEYTQGQSLLLSSNDRMNLAVQLELARQNSDLKDLRPLGWFVSHMQDSVSLSASDLEIYNGFFPAAWQVALVICPKGGGSAQAGFFVREADNKLQAEASYHCFDLKPLQPLQPSQPTTDARRVTLPELETEHRGPVPPTQRPSMADPVLPVQPVPPVQRATQPLAFARASGRVQPTKPAPPARETPDPTFQPPSFQTEDRLPTNERWLWAIPVILALGIAAFVLYQRRAPSANGVALRASSEAQTVHLTWDASSRAIRDSYRGEIEISDGGKDSRISLSSEQLHAGKLSYLPQSADVVFEITVYPRNGDPIQDSTRLIAPVLSAPTEPPQLLPASPPSSSPPPPSPPSSRAAPASPAPASQPKASLPAPQPADQPALAQQVEQLKQQLGRERARADELQNLVRILENRLGITATTPKAAAPGH